MRSLSLKLPESLLAKLNLAAKRRGESMSALVREAIEAFLDAGPGRGKGSCLDLASDLAGSVKGPRDLSFDKEHMGGYGQ